MSKHNATKNGWIPAQHGAWAMVVAPAIVGPILALRYGVGQWWIVPLTLLWLPAWFTFNAVTLWIKVPVKRRARYQPALFTYLGISAALGLVALALGAWHLWPFIFALAPCLAVSFWLTMRGQERHWIAGFTTTLAASMIPLITVYTPNTTRPALVAGASASILLFAYFFGTVIHVKSLIRERRSKLWAGLNVGWYSTFTVLTLVPGIGGDPGLARPLWFAWAIFFGAAVVRSIYCLKRRSANALSAKAIGIMEAFFSVGALILAAMS